MLDSKKIIAILLTVVFMIPLTSHPVLAENTVQVSDIKFFVKVNPQFFDIIITDQKVVNDIKTYLQKANDTQKAKAELLSAIGDEVFAVRNLLLPFDIMFIDKSVVLVYTYNPNYVYESDTKLALPMVKLKAPVPITISKDFITKCNLYSKGDNTSKCKYTLETQVKDTFVSNTVPKLVYSKEKLELDNKNIYIFVDSTGNVLVLTPEKFNLGVIGSCNESVIKDNSTDYKMYVCKSVDHIDFSKLPVGEYKVYITFNKDNTNIFKIDQMSYKIVTCLRQNIKVEKETFEADKLFTLYFEKVNCTVEKKSSNMWLYIGAVVGVLAIGFAVWYFRFRRGDEGEELFE